MIPPPPSPTPLSCKQFAQCLKTHGYSMGSYRDGFTQLETADPVLIREALAADCQVRRYDCNFINARHLLHVESRISLYDRVFSSWLLAGVARIWGVGGIFVVFLLVCIIVRSIFHYNGRFW